MEQEDRIEREKCRIEHIAGYSGFRDSPLVDVSTSSM